MQLDRVAFRNRQLFIAPPLGAVAEKRKKHRLKFKTNTEMNEKIESITNSLIKLYSGGNSKSEIKFRKKLENIDWDEEQKKLKRNFDITKIALIVTLVSFIILFVIFAIGTIKHGQSQISTSSAIAVCGASIVTSLGFKQNSERYQTFILLRDLLER